MPYVIEAACLGFLAAWFIRWAFHAEEMSRLQEESRIKLMERETDAVGIRVALAAKEAELTAVRFNRKELERLSLQLESKNSTITDLKEHLAAAETEVAKISNYESEILRLRTRNAELEPQSPTALKSAPAVKTVHTAKKAVAPKRQTKKQTTSRSEASQKAKRVAKAPAPLADKI